MDRAKIIERRREFRLEGYTTLAEVGFDGDWVSPYQISSASPEGPVLVAYHWLDVPTVRANRAILHRLGYLPRILFNRVVDRALELVELSRADLYVTQAFHLLPEKRSQTIPSRLVAASFNAVTRHEIEGRAVIALGSAAAAQCESAGIPFSAVPHPSARGQTINSKAQQLAQAISTCRRSS